MRSGDLPSYAIAYARPPRRQNKAFQARVLVVSLTLASLLAFLVLVGKYSYDTADEEGDSGWAGSSGLAISWSARADAETFEDPLKAEAVRRAMQHAWHGYERYAWGADELRPASKQGKSGVTGGMNGFNGLGASIIDAMSTLNLMGLDAEFERAHAWVAENMTFDPPARQQVSFFETTIRLLGGLLSAHDLSGHRLFLDKAEQLGSRLLPVFDGARTGILTNGAALPWSDSRESGGGVVLAECGTNLIELGTLSARTRNVTYRWKAEGGIRYLHALYPDQPLLGVTVDRRSGRIQDFKKTLGAPVDSYFEYLLKYWILRGKTDDHWRDRWVNATDAALRELVVRPAGVNFTFTGELGGGASTPQPLISHLGCFWPGNVALGVMQGAVAGDKAAAYLDFARSMMAACYQLYNATATGLGADEARVDLSTGRVTPTHLSYMQRPEVVESLFYMWRATHDQVYRHWGWTILQAIERHCRKDAGYSGTSNVQDNPPHSDDVQQSWFLAETLKYLYLLYCDDSVLPLDRWVFNTEAHPVRAEVPEPQAPWVDWDWLMLPLPGERGGGTGQAAVLLRSFL